MSELNNIDHLADIDFSEEEVSFVEKLSVPKKMKLESFSETNFLQKEDEVEIYGESWKKKFHQYKKDNFSIYSSNEVNFYSYLDEDIKRNSEGLISFSENIFYKESERVLYFFNHILGLPKDAKIYFYPVYMLCVINGRRIFFSWEENYFTMQSNDYSYKNNGDTTIFIDKNGNIATNYLDSVITMLFDEKKIEVNGYNLFFKEKDKAIEIKNKWIKIGDLLFFNGLDGSVKYNYSYLKIPKKSQVFLDKEDLVVKIFNGENISFLAQVDRLVFRDSDYWLVFDLNSRIILDKKGSIAFFHNEELLIVDQKNKIIKGNGLSLGLYKGSIIRVTATSIYLNELVSLQPKERKLKIAKFTIILQTDAHVSYQEKSVLIETEHNEIRIIPFKKQLFINVGGKLVILTVTIGIAINPNGNIAFDYRGSLSSVGNGFCFMNLADILTAVIDNPEKSLTISDNKEKKEKLIEELISKIFAELLSLVQNNPEIKELIKDIISSIVNEITCFSDFNFQKLDVNELMDIITKEIEYLNLEELVSLQGISLLQQENIS
jgi:hypothetical protein